MNIMLLSVIFTLISPAMAQHYRPDVTTGDYHHEWNWEISSNETAHMGRCASSYGVVSKWRAQEKNEGDFWRSLINCKDIKGIDGTLQDGFARTDHYEYDGEGNYVESRVDNTKLPVGLKLKYKTFNGSKKVIDFTLLELPASKVSVCDVGPVDAGWATGRTSANHEIVKLFCNCGVMTSLDVIKRKPALSGAEITGVKITCKLLKR